MSAAWRLDRQDGNGARPQFERASRLDRAEDRSASSARAGRQNADGHRERVDRDREHTVGVCASRVDCCFIGDTATNAVGSGSFDGTLVALRLSNGVEFDLGEASIDDLPTVIHEFERPLGSGSKKISRHTRHTFEIRTIAAP